MPHLVADDGTTLRYRLDGPEQAPLLVLSNSLGTDLGLWEPQMPALSRHFRVLRYDTRGHGGSGVPQRPYQVERLGRDVLALLDMTGTARAHFCGISMGGMVGMWLGRHAAARVAKLVLCNTAAKIGTAEVWNGRIAAVREGGMEGLLGAVIERWFTAGFRERAPGEVERIAAMLRTTPAAGYVAACEAIRDMDQRGDLALIRSPTLVVAGSYDPSTPAADGRLIAGAIPGARYIELPVAHLSNIEAAAEFTEAIVAFLTE